MPTSIYNPVSPTDTYCIYDQFHFGNKDHLEVPVKGYQQALDAYAFYRASYPALTLGLCTVEYYKHLKTKWD